jgi:hypothetical protein
MNLRPVLILLVATCSALVAADTPAPPLVLANQVVGEGMHGKPSPVIADQVVDSGVSLARVNFADGAKGFMLLAPGTKIHLKQASSKDGLSLVVAIDSGRIEVSLDKRGPYADVHVLGGSLDVRVTGTLFVVERQAHDQDYVALIHGKVSVHMRQDVTASIAAGARDAVELDDKQGISGGPNGMSATTDTLSSRPQLLVTSSLHEQGSQQNSNWDQDSALSSLDANGNIGNSVSQDLSSNIGNHIANTIENEIGNQITNQINNDDLGHGGKTNFGAPPGPP